MTIAKKYRSLVKKLRHRDSDTAYELLGVNKGAKASYEFVWMEEVEKAREKRCILMCVGEEEKRYQIPMQYLSHPAFQQLLKRIQMDPDDNIEGRIKIPYSTQFFDQFLKIVKDTKSRCGISRIHFSKIS